MSDDKKKIITDPDAITDMINSQNPNHVREGSKRMTQQAQRALHELQMQMADLVAQVLGFMPSPQQRSKHGKVERGKDGKLVIYWNGIAFLKLSRVMAKRKLMRVGEQNEKIQFYQNYEILKDDPIGYKKANPTTNYQATHYPDDVDPEMN